MPTPSVEREPLITFYFGRSVPWFRTMWHVGRLTVWTRFFSFTVGRRGPLHDGWPE